MAARINKIIYTKHAEERMYLRRITQSMISDTLTKPDRTQIEEDGDTEFIRTLKGRKVHVIAKPLANNEWLIKSTWVRGEDDPRQPMWEQIVSWLIRQVTALLKSSGKNTRR